MFGSVLSEDARRSLALLGQSGVIKDAYLAGGSALALHYGHRESLDFDFFTPQPVDPVKIAGEIAALGDFTVDVAKGISLIGTFQGMKLSYFRYEYPQIAAFHPYLGVAVADPRDIAAMKLSAISDRATKKDYIDLYQLAHSGLPVEAMFACYDEKYHLLEVNRYMLTKSLGYFDDAEASVMPRMLTSLTWDTVKAFFAAESLRLGREALEG